MGGAKGGNQPHSRGVAPDQRGRARHQVAVHAFRPDHPVVAAGGVTHQPLETRKIHRRVGQRMGEVEDRAVVRLPVDAAEHQLLRRRQPVEHHLPGLPHRGQLRRVAEQHQQRKDLAQIVELALVQHRGFVDQPDVQRILAPLPAGDEIRAPQPRRRERAGDRAVLLIEQQRAVHGLIAQRFDHRTFAGAHQPLGQTFVFGIVNRRIKDAVDGGGGHAAGAQHKGGLVGRRQNRHAAGVLAAFCFVISADHMHPGGDQRPGDLGQQQRLAGPGLAQHRQHLRLAGRGRHDFFGHEVHAGGGQRLGQPVPGLGLVGGKRRRVRPRGAGLKAEFRLHRGTLAAPACGAKRLRGLSAGLVALAARPEPPAGIFGPR